MEWPKRLADGSMETLLAVAAGLIIVWQRSDNKAIVARLTTTIGSGMLALSVGEEVATWAGTPELVTTVGIAVLGPIVLDTAALAISEPKQLLEWYKLWRGK